mmetsp:Transcript_1308/g.1741  ORF Transcript_1308/g.1741 Transcript_1308/m.1741 type:complete len:203 (+) Transcript_1308:3-611(+)
MKASATEKETPPAPSTPPTPPPPASSVEDSDKASSVEDSPEKAEKQAEIRSLVESTKPGKTADELIAAYDGKEDELIKNLKKMKSKQDIREKKTKQSEIRSLVDETNPGKTADELIAAYEGKEDELIKNLKKMKSKQELKASKAKASSREVSPVAAVRDEITQLVAKTNPGKSASDLLAAYEGREQELLSHLRKLQSSKGGV